MGERIINALLVACMLAGVAAAVWGEHRQPHPHCIAWSTPHA